MSSSPPPPSHGAAQRVPGQRRGGSLRQVEETSAGGLVLDRADLAANVALIGRTDRRGRLLWSLPKGHIEAGETIEQAAVREVQEETGILGTIAGKLGVIDFWFVAGGHRVHKTVHHYLMVVADPIDGLELSDADAEVTEVAWVPLAEASSQLTYGDERRLLDHVPGLLEGLG